MIPIDMTPWDMAEELAERDLLEASIEEILKHASASILEGWLERDDRAIQAAYMDMVGVHTDEM